MRLGIGFGIDRQTVTESGEVDPLEGISFRLRLEAYDESFNPICAYTDLAGTIPVSDVDVDSIASVRNGRGDNSIAATQSNASFRFLYTTEDGRPAWFLDSVDDRMEGTLPDFGEAMVFRAKALSVSTGALWADDGAPDNAHHPYSNAWFYEPFRVVSRAEGDGAAIDVLEWHVYRCENVGGTFRMWVNGSLLSTQSIAVREGPGLGFVIGYGNVTIPSGGAAFYSGLLTHQYILTNASDAATVEAYLMSL